MKAVVSRKQMKTIKPPLTQGDRAKTFSCSGFTLLELIIVMFIISMMLAVTFPSFSALQAHKIKADAGRVASLLRCLNDSAISTKESRVMQVNIKQGTLHIRGPEGEKTEKIETLSGITLHSKGRISDGEVPLSFSPTGAGEHFTIHLIDKEASMDVSFNALSGRVKVSSNERI
jgi:prepilin-type N-terminal cleavage/methylation domain-containing protein